MQSGACILAANTTKPNNARRSERGKYMYTPPRSVRSSQSPVEVGQRCFAAPDELLISAAANGHPAQGMCVTSLCVLAPRNGKCKEEGTIQESTTSRPRLTCKASMAA